MPRSGIADRMEVLEAELWQLVDQRPDQVRRLPYDEMLRRTAGEPELELLELPSGAFRRRTRVIACPHDRLGITVRVTAEGRRRSSEGGIVITSTAALAPEWFSQRRAHARQPIRVRPCATLAGLTLCAVLLLMFSCSPDRQSGFPRHAGITGDRFPATVAARCAVRDKAKAHVESANARSSHG